MFRIIAAVGVIVAVFVGLFALSFDRDTTDESPFSAIQSAMTDGSKLVDVRESDEFSESYIQGAINLPLSQIETGSFGNLDKSKTHYLYCRSGNRSAQATELFKQAGYTVVDLGAMTSVAQGGGTVCTQSC